ncbi:receptor-like serine/threonine-protein kinase SD1-8 isoform X1 [Lactuca sativa]|uniref:receptor-like serine/threonine-protein kinase SD1-8 isoform X1 n=1 Tax=Lactuca sativa TaxID=4236 RepID=UPI000CD9233F|nr:receptor-like serine/threonine-protein kinase SD1-8 isoform X1 [Lactuca sativa]
MKTLHSHCSTFMFVFSLFFYPFLSLAVDTITPTQPLTISQTLVSNGEVFELGFFNPGNNNLYIGIWYKQIQQKTYVWVANRDTPITSSSGNLTIISNGNMVLVNQTGTVVWSTNQPTQVVKTVGQLLDNGNFVLRPENDENPENYIWQSFDYPTDTLLPEMKLGWDRKSGIHRFLRSWKTNIVPSTGDYSFKLDIAGFPELVTMNDETIIWRSGPWNGLRFSGTPQMVGLNIMKFELQDNSDEITYSFEMLDSSIYSRFVVNSSGITQRLVWAETTKTWNTFWYFPGDFCDQFGECGPFGVCDTSTAPFCNCMTGFRPKNKHAWHLRDGKDGCVRSSVMDCGSDGFLQLKNMKLPESSNAFVDQTINLSECGAICKKNCSCAAYASMNITEGGSGCVIWVGDLMDIRHYADSENRGQDLYVRAAASDLDQSIGAGSSKNDSGNGNHVGKIVGITISTCVVLIFLLVLVYSKSKKTRTLKKSLDRTGPQERTEDFVVNKGAIVPSRKDYYNETTMDELELPLFDFKTLAMATNNFSDTNKLGQGGFGCVYKGILTEGEVVAVKRLSRICEQGIEELKNEVQLIAKLQHRNLVRVLGCCIEVEEKLLIYEFMENKSLDMFLFDKEKNMKLNWKIRIDIIHGIARGLLYLHQDSRFKIIHRDMKASNILLDKDMNPKISDFGIARIFGRDQTEAETKIVVGTYGYMSPEYAMDGHFSTKSDVFSFGVLILEIVSGKKNRGSSNTSSQLNLLGQAWKIWNEDNALELLDESIRANFSENEVLRCIQIGLLCVQEQPEDRPDMANVVLLLSSENVRMPQPKHPGFFIRKNNKEIEYSSKDDDSKTINGITISILDGR